MKSIKNIAILLLTLLTTIKSHAQVNLQTGSATFSLPMFSWQDDKSRLNAIVALGYSSGNGLKVNDVASNVGQGWNFMAGGVITRMQVGEPDDQVPVAGAFNDRNKKCPPGYLYNTVAPSAGCPQNVNKYPIFGNQNVVYTPLNNAVADREQDLFTFQFNGRTGTFVLGKDNGDKGILIGDSRVKIWFDRASATTMGSLKIRTSIIAFHIKDENGLIYTYKDLGLSKLLTPSNAPDPPGPTQSVVQTVDTYDYNLYDAPYIVNEWYLSEIKDPIVSRSVLFNYDIANISNRGAANITNYSTPIQVDPQWTPFGPFAVSPTNQLIITKTLTVLQQPTLSSIIFPDGHVLSCDYGNMRVDWNGAKVLAGITGKYQGKQFLKYQFNSTYLMLNRYGTPLTVQDKQNARLYLKSVQKISNDLTDAEPAYYFDYYLGSSNPDDFVPPPFYHIKDIWGYFNGDYSYKVYYGSPYVDQDGNPITISFTDALSALDYSRARLLCFQNNPANPTMRIVNPKPGYAKNGLLKTISYPTGGTLTYEYSQRKGVVPGIDKLYQGGVATGGFVGGVSVSKTTVDGGSSPSQSTTYDYIMPDGTSSLWGLELPTNKTDNVSYLVREGKNFHLFDWSCGGPTCCTYGYQYPGVLQPTSNSVGGGWDLSSTVSLVASGIQTGMGIASAMEIASLRATHVVADVAKAAQLAHVAAVANIAEVAFQILVSYLSTCDDGIHYTYTASYTNSNLNDANPLPTSYKRVEVSQTGSLSNGKTVVEYTSDDDYPIWAPDNPNLTKNQRYASWAYGLPRKTTVYDASNNVIKTSENIYDFSSHIKADVNPSTSNNMSCNCYVKQTRSQNNDTWAASDATPNSVGYTTSSTSDVIVIPYDYYTGRAELAETHERTYKPSDRSQYLETIVRYDYNPTNFQVKKITSTRSNGDQDIKEIYYPEDYTSTGIIQTLKDNNIVDVPIASYGSMLKKGASAPVYMGASVSNLGTIGNGDIKPLSAMLGRASQPVTNFTFDPNNPFNYPNLVQTQSFSYDGNGNMVGARDEGNRTMGNIYGYNDKYIIASVINADPNTDKPAYTSFEDITSLGGWALSGTFAPIVGTSVTGANCLNLNGISLTASQLNTTKKYRLSFWSTGPVNISGGSTTSIVSSPAIKGFTYHEYEIAAGASSITISGSVGIDELRLYPAAARMRTVTYDPLVGKTSECDENNHISYYEYDKFNRLRLLKDENGHIVKMYEYNTKHVPGSEIVSPSSPIPYTGQVYARFSYEHPVYSPPYTYVDVVIKLYLDAAGTIPLPFIPSNLYMNILQTGDCLVADPSNSSCGNYGENTYPVLVNSQTFVLFQGVAINYLGSWTDQGGDHTCPCSQDYSLIPGTGYTIIN